MHYQPSSLKLNSLGFWVSPAGVYSALTATYSVLSLYRIRGYWHAVEEDSDQLMRQLGTLDSSAQLEGWLA